MGRKRVLNLTPQQRKAAELLAFNEEGRTNRDIAREIGITEQTLYRWKALPDFVYLVNEYADQIMETFLAEAYKDLRKLSRGAKSDAARLKAIELILKNRGRMKDVADVTAKVEDTRITEDILSEVDALKERLGLTASDSSM
jgi:predicted transcriptional regulator